MACVLAQQKKKHKALLACSHKEQCSLSGMQKGQGKRNRQAARTGSGRASALCIRMGSPVVYPVHSQHANQPTQC